MEGMGSIGGGTGALLRARVLGNTDKGAIVLVKGKPVTVQGTTELKEGGEVRGRIVSSREGLRFEVRQELPILDRSAKSGQAHLGTFLKNNGIVPNELNLLAGHKAIQLGQPLTPELFAQVQRFSSLLPEVTEKDVHSLLFMISGGLNIQRRTLSMARDHLEGKSSMKSLIKGFFGFSSKGSLGNSTLGRYLPQLTSQGFDLRRFFTHSGINSESRLQQGEVTDDLLSELHRQGRKDLVKSIKDLFSFTKILNQGEKAEQEQILTVPYMVEDELEEMVVRYKKDGSKKDNKGGAQSLDLYLEMSKLGALMISFSLKDQSAGLVIRSARKDVASFLEGAQTEFEKELGAIENVSNARVRILRESFRLPELIPEGPAKPIRVDLKV
jgi:hypothetical protein